MAKMFLDDVLVDADEVVMPVLSRGFAYGFGVFETMKFIGGRPCFFGEHLDRLRRAVEAAGLKVELEESVLRYRARRLFEKEGVREGVFKIVISDRGEGTQVAMFVRTSGIANEPPPVRLLASEICKASKAFTSRHKSLNYMESVLELEKAKTAGFDECVFSNEYGELTECSVANLFWIKGGVLRTPAIDCGLLAGIVRSKVIGLARAAGLAVEEGRFSERDLLEADEAFLTSSGAGPRSVASFTDRGEKEKAFAVEFLPRLRSAYLEMEGREAVLSDG